MIQKLQEKLREASEAELSVALEELWGEKKRPEKESLASAQDPTPEESRCLQAPHASPRAMSCGGNSPKHRRRRLG